MKKKVILSVIIAILVITVIVESILLGVGYYSRVPKLKNGEEKMVTLSTGTELSVDDIYNKVKDQYALQTILDIVDLEILTKEYKDDKDIENQIESRVVTVQTNYPDENSLNQYLSYFGCDDLDEYREYLRLDFMKEKAGKEYAKTLVTDKEIKDYYKNEYVGDIAAKHILVTPKDDKTTEANDLAKKVLSKIDELVKGGTKIDDAFQKAYDEFKGQGDLVFQDLEYFNKGDMVAPFEKAAFEMKVGTYSTSPVYTQYGYHLIYKYDQKEKGKLEDVKEELKTTIANNNYNDNSSVLEAKALKELREKYELTIVDSDLKGDYERYVNYTVNQK